MLKSPNDEKLFEYYATSQLAIVTLDGKVKEIGQPGIYDTLPTFRRTAATCSFRVSINRFRIFSRLTGFPKEVEVWDMSGKMDYKVASIPLQDKLPVQGVPTGPRGYGWIPTEPATLMWAEALDGGDPRKKVTPRDRLVKIAAPFTEQPAEVIKIEQRYQGRTFGEKNGMMWFFDYNRDTQRRRIFMTDYRNPSTAKLISDLNVNDRYNDIGNPVTKMLPNGYNAVQQNGDYVFLTGAGSSPEGDRPFLRRMDLNTLQNGRDIPLGKGRV